MFFVKVGTQYLAIVPERGAFPVDPVNTPHLDAANCTALNISIALNSRPPSFKESKT